MMIRGDGAAMTVHSVVGDQFFFDLVDHFYAGVERDERLRSMYPDDLADSKRYLAEFLIQYWGGPTTYSDGRGHPRLRMRHIPFEIDDQARDAWLEHMLAGVAALAPPEEVRNALDDYFTMAADAMVNTR